VNHLDLFLLTRLQEVGRVVRMFQTRDEYQDVAKGGNYRRADRILGLWGQSMEDTSAADRAEAARKRLMVLRRRILALKDSPLYKQIGRRRQRRIRLRMTNILSNDSTYRKVAELWLAWEKHVRSGVDDPQQRWIRLQAAASGYDAFLFLLVVRALSDLGFEPDDDSLEAALEPGDVWTLHSAIGDVTLERRYDDVRLSVPDGAKTLRFVALPAALDAVSHIDEWIQTVERPDTVVAYLPGNECRASEQARRRLLNLENIGPDARTGFLPAAPWDVESVERVARAIRWFLWSALYEEYPVSVQLPSVEFLPADTPEWLNIVGSTTVCIRTPSDHASQWAELQKKLQASEVSVIKAEEAFAQVPKKDARGRLHANKALSDVKEQRDNLALANERIGELSIRAVALLQCPVCRTAATSERGNWSPDTREFRCICSGCNASWGRRNICS